MNSFITAWNAGKLSKSALIDTAEKLLARMDELSAEDQTEAVRAFAEMSQALWNVLEGIYNQAIEG